MGLSSEFPGAGEKGEGGADGEQCNDECNQRSLEDYEPSKRHEYDEIGEIFANWSSRGEFMSCISTRASHPYPDEKNRKTHS